MSRQNIFDNPEFFEGYQEIRQNPLNANLTEEQPALRAMLPPLLGKRVLDLGCGAGEGCAYYCEEGAAFVLGVDVSEKMLALAKEKTAGCETTAYRRVAIEDIAGLGERFDIVVSSLAAHYVEDFDKTCRDVFALLEPGGCFVFSQEHPFTSAPKGGPEWREENGEVFYRLRNYAESGRRTDDWLTAGRVSYHRTFSDVINALAGAGFRIAQSAEPLPPDWVKAQNPAAEKFAHKPNFFVIRADKE